MNYPWGGWPPPPEAGGPPGPPGPAGPPGPVGRPVYIWRPGGVPSAVVLTTAAAVESVIVANSGNVIIQLDASIAPCVWDGSRNVDCFSRTILETFTPSSIPLDLLVTDDSLFTNLGTLRNINLHGAPTATPLLAFTQTAVVLTLERGARITLDAGAVVVAGVVGAGANLFQVALFEGGTLINNSATPGLAMFTVAPALTTILGVGVALAASLTGGAYPATAFGGGAGGTLLVLADASAPLVPQTLYTGTVTSVVADLARGVSYDDTLVTPPLAATNVQDAIDALKTLVDNIPATDYGTYSPTISNTSNLSASGSNPAQWSQVGNVVTVSGILDVTLTAPLTGCALEINLPVPSNFASSNECAGAGAATQPGSDAVFIFGETTNNTARFTWQCGGTTGPGSLSFTFTYQVF